MNTSLPKARSHWPLVMLSTFPSLLGVFLPLILVRLVTSEEVGTFKIFFLYLGIAPALSLTSGLRSGLAYWSGQASSSAQAFAATSSLILGLGLVAAAGTLVSRYEIAQRLHATPLEVSLFGLSLLGAIAGAYFEEAAIATGRIWTGALFYCGSEIIRGVVIVTTLIYYRSVLAVLIAHTVVTTLKLISGYLYGYYLGLVGFALKRDIVRDVWRYALPVSLAYIFGVFIGSADQFLLSSRISASEFALYSIGCLSVAPLLTFEQSVTRVLIPQMAEAFARKERRHAIVLYQSAVDTLAFILVPAVTGLIVFANPIVELLFTNRYSDATRYLHLFALSYLLVIVPHDALARARGEAVWILKTFFFFALTSFLLCYLLIPLGGPRGALTGILLSGAALRAYSVLYFRDQLSAPLSTFLPLNTCAHYILVSLGLGALAASIQPLFLSSRGWLCGGGALFSLGYLLGALPRKNRGERIRLGDRGVLILSQSLRVGGLEQVILHLCKALKAEGRWRVRVLAYDHTDGTGSLLDSFIEAGIPVDCFKKAPGFSMRAVSRILITIFRNDIHIIHSNDLGTLVYAVIVKLCSFGRVSIVHTQHSLPISENTARYRLYRHIASTMIDRLSVVSEKLCETYSPFLLRRSPIHVIENGVLFPSEPILERDDKIELRNTITSSLPIETRQRLSGLVCDLWIIYLARFYPGKGQDHALSLWREMLPADRARSILCLIGPESAPGEYERIRKIIATVPDRERVFMLEGSRSPLQWMQAGDLFLSCSQSEGMPLAPLEAAGSGVPLLLSRIPGHAFLSGNSSQFLLEDFGEGSHQMRALLSGILKGGDRYQAELWERSRKIRERFSVANMAAKYSKLYEINTA